nr:hypothetical protein [Tanacetum cinerariifolium]
MQRVLREIKLQQTLDKNNCRIDARLNRSKELIESEKKIRENGVVGLKDCIDYISQALAIMARQTCLIKATRPESTYPRFTRDI